MENPYDAPNAAAQSTSARSRLLGPALGILVVSVLWMVLWMFLGATGIVYFVSQILDPEMTATDRQIPITFSLYILISALYSGMLASGAFSMMRRNSYMWATATAILAMVPFLGPCYILGIPFGIWAYLVLRDPDVRSSFSNPRYTHVSPKSTATSLTTNLIHSLVFMMLIVREKPKQNRLFS